MNGASPTGCWMSRCTWAASVKQPAQASRRGRFFGMLQDRLVAHRGYQRNYPENTLLAYREAIAAGARAIETDVQLSADRQPVLYHDATLSRVSGRRGRVDQLTLAQLLALPAHEPKRFAATFVANRITPLSALVELLAAHPGVTAYIEIKHEALAFVGIEQCYRIIADCLAPVASQCVLIRSEEHTSE